MTMFSDISLPVVPDRWYKPLRYIRQLWRSLFRANHYIVLAICSHDQLTNTYRAEVFYYRERRRLHVQQLQRVWQLITGNQEAKRAVVTDVILDLLGTVYVDESNIHPSTRIVQSGGREVVHPCIIMADHITREKLREPETTSLLRIPREFKHQPDPADVIPYLHNALAA